MFVTLPENYKREISGDLKHCELGRINKYNKNMEEENLKSKIICEKVEQKNFSVGMTWEGLGSITSQDYCAQEDVFACK